MSRLLLVFFLLCAGCTSAERSSRAALRCELVDADAIPEAEAAQDFLDGRVRQGLPGLQLSIDRPGLGAFHGAAGFADLGAGIELRACNLTRAGSINKTVTAVVVLQLVDEGVLALDGRLRDYLPEKTWHGIANAEQATVRQALQHSSGMPNWIRSLNFQTASLDDLDHAWSADQLLDFARAMPAAFQPGTEVDYSNTNTLLLGLAVEHLTGMALAEVYTERVYEPLALESTRFAGAEPQPAELIRGYVDLRNDGRLTDSTNFSGWDVHADGGLLSRPSDLVQILRAATDGTLVPETLLSEMLEGRHPDVDDPDFFPIEYGLGVFRMETPQGVWWFHSGDAIGYAAVAMVREEDGVAVSWATNGNYGTLDALSSSEATYREVLEIVGSP